MDRQQENQRSRQYGIGLLGCTALAVLVLSSATATAQTSSYQSATDNVQINWGALNGGAAPAPVQPSYGYMPAPAATGGLLMPGPNMPHSTLHVPAPGANAGVTLRQPASAPKMASKPAAPKITAPAPKIAAAPKPPAPAQAAPKQLTEAKAPPPAPAPAAPPAPAAAPAKAVTASAPPPPPAPETAGAPPPPPMPTAAAPAAPKPAETAAAAPKAAEQASTSTATPADGPIKVVFNGDDTKLSADGQSVLEGVLGKLSANENTRVQLMAYAAGDDLTSSKARRISLSRALSVRSFLIEKGVRSTRIDVRALGDKSDGEPKNRVDVNVIER